MIAGAAVDTTSRAANALGAVFSKLYAGAKRVGVAIGQAFLAVPKLIGRGIRSAMKFAAIVTGLGSIGGLAGMGMLVQGQMQTIDATAKLSDRVGIATEKLAGLRHAAEITGSGALKLDAALQVMQKRLGEVAIKGTGAAAPALEALHLRAKDLIALSPDVAFGAIADAMAGLATQSERNAVTANIFSRANQDLVNTLALGTAGFAAMEAEAKQLGIAFSRLDAAKVEQANDAITRMKTAIKGVAGTAAIALAPLIERYADSITTRVPMIVAAIRRVGSIAVTVWNHIATGFQNAWQYIVATLAPFQDSFRSAFETVVSHLDVMLGSWEGFRGGVIHIATQAAFAFQAIWEHVKHQFIVIQTHMVSFASAAWETFVTFWDTSIGTYLTNSFKQVGLNLANNLLGPTITLAGEAMAKLIALKSVSGPEGVTADVATAAAETARGTMSMIGDTLASIAATAEVKSQAALGAEAKRHKGAMDNINSQAAAEAAAWAERMGDLPKFSESFRDAVEGAIPGFKPGEMPALAGVSGGGETRYASAMERDSAAARRTIYEAGRGGTDTVEKEQLKTLKRQMEILQRIDSKTGAEETVSIPSG
jgi:hypothetical protein